MTKKHYEMIASIILSLTDDQGYIDRDDLVVRLSDYFERDNPDFDADKFAKACYSNFPKSE